MAGNKVDLEIGDADGCIKETESSSYYIWQYFTVSNSSDQKKKKVVQKLQSANFVTTFSGYCTLRAAAHILGRSVLGQAKAGIQVRISINKKDDDRRAILKNAQLALSKVM